MKLKTIKLLAALAAVCCFSSAFADSVRVIGNEATIGSATQSSGGYRWEGGQSTMTITFETPAGSAEGDTLLFSELKMVSAGDDGNNYTGAYGRRLSIVVDDVTYTSGKVILTSSTSIGSLTGQNVLTYNFPNVPVKAGASYTLTLLDRPEGKTGVRYAVTNSGSIIYVGSSDDTYKPIAVATVTPVLTSSPVAGSTVLLSNTATSGAVSESGAGECNITLSIPASDALPLGTVVRIKKINLASWNDTFVDWDTTNNKSDPYFIKVNNVKSLSIVGTSTDPGSAPTTDLTTATILANETTAFNRLSFAFSAICDLTVGTEYPAASGNNASTGVALLYRNGNLCYGGSQDRAAVRYVESDTPSILSSAAASGAYPIYEMYAEVLGKVTVKDGETVNISDLNAQAADAVLMVTVESGATVNIDATPVENIEFYGNNFSLVNGVVTADGVAVRVMEGATLANLGAKRDFAGWTVDDGVTIGVTQTAAEYGTGLTTVANADNVSSITVYAPDGTTVAGTITPSESSTLATSVKTSGLATWCDYEFNGDKSNSGTDKTGLTSDVDTTTYPEIFNNSMLYTYTHPYRGVTYPNSWTAVVRCTVPELENAIVVMFGTYGAGAIGLVAGSNPEEEMLLVSTPGAVEQAEDKHFTTLATMKVKDATTAQHVYVFTKDGTKVNVYCDGEKVLEDYQLASATLGGGLQIGSLHGGVVQSGVHTGLVRFGAGESQISSLTLAQQQNARIDCMRMYNYIVSPEQVAALSVEFPAVKLYRATVAEDADTSWTDLSWTPAWDGGNTQSKVILTTEGDATVALPESITVDEVQLDLADDSTLTLTGPGSLAITQPVSIEDGTLKLTGTVTLTQDTALNGSVVFDAFTAAGTGALKLSNGATVGVASGSVVVTPLGNYTLAEGTVVDSAYTGDGVKLIPLTSAACSLTSGTTVRYYSDATGVFDTFKDELATDEALVYTILDDTDWSSYAGLMVTWGYYFDQAAGTIELAAATIAAQNKAYTSLSAAVADAAENAIVKLFRDSSEAITLNKAITLNENGKAFSGTLTGNGTLTFYAFRNNPSITFTDWTGTVVLPEFAANGTIFNNYGVTGSTVVLKGITGGWLGETSAGKMDVNPVLQLDGDVTIKGFSTSWTYTFTEITGEGNFSLDPTDNSPGAVSITKVAEGFTGVITNNTTKTLTIGTLAREAGTSTDVDTKLLDIGGTGGVVVEAVTIGGEPADVYLVYEDDGVYVGVPPVAAVYDDETLVGNFASLTAAIEAAEGGQKVVLLAATDEDVTVDKVVEVEAGVYNIDGTITVRADGATVTLLNEPELGENTWILGRNTETGVITVGYGLTCQLMIVCSNSGVVTPTGDGVREVLQANTWEVRGGTEVTLTATPGTDYSGYEYRVDSGYYTVISDVEQHNLVFENNVATITVTADTQASVTFVVREQEFTIPASAHMVVDRVYKWGESETVYEPDPETGKYSITQGTSIVVRYTPVEGYMVAGPGGYYELNLQVTAETDTVDNASAEAAATKVVAMVGDVPYDSLTSAISMSMGNTVVLMADVEGEDPMNGAGVLITSQVTIDLNGHSITGTDGIVCGDGTNNGYTLTIDDTVGTGNVIATAADGCAVWARGFSVVINGGNYQNNSIEEATIYTNVDGATVTINGGTFTNLAKDYKWNNSDGSYDHYALNVKNELIIGINGIRVYGGTFSYDPAKGDDKIEGTFVADGYQSTETSPGVWTVAEVQEVPVTPGAQTEPVETEEAAQAEAAKVVPSVPTAVAEELTDEQETAYKALFEAKVVPVTVGETIKYAVEVVMKDTVAADIQEAVDAEAEDFAEAAADAAADAVNGGSATVTTTPGLYYVVEAGTEVDGIAPASCTLATGSTLDLTLPNKGTKGFYKLRVSVTPVTVPVPNND